MHDGEVTPAATFILLSYNQESSIRASMESVLTQDCEPIEIIVSDDASTDGTFTIIKQLAQEYAGPHRVIARQNDVNIGTNRHIERAIELSSADLMIWTAGDDINATYRAKRIIEAFRQTQAKLLFSNAITISSDGTAGSDAYRRALFYREYSRQEAALSFELYLGATAAWHKDLYRKYGGFPPERAYEDLILGFRAVLEQGVHYINEKLVTYQEGVGISSQLAKHVSKLGNRERRTAILHSQIKVLEQRLRDAKVFGLAADDPVQVAIVTQLETLQVRLDYYTWSADSRRRLLARPLRHGNALLAEAIRDLRKR
ncbi:Glycosyl transferase family 2 [Roseovarius nanhaiticus]|uniref:Glycosyl transferase family 2 n=1 Tax=Roseovarius nanhaiticus TaxID=573024 RepID=A0A1N7H4J6_9RHOB|nr:glycosyltransferase [Roseovarius nanhaiticus]SEL13170.1 Glycosyl transferase family 2 [Roseovarius nanhaiticus]SIS19775.1 Glycosyl transferase family 2 [Roseovarius nanhaiticus]